ncbi:MAG: membrane protein insertase YidC [Bacteroidetes bacterium]|nr:membrane protein insertase YidC [Bacteroidota bacterium]MCW5894600.1 membrane protein insertase YidC [Bacteroidota bacterium]
MDRQATIGFVLIAVVLMVWMWANTPPPPPHSATMPDTAHVPQPATDQGQASLQAAQPGRTEEAPSEDLGRFFSSRATGTEKILIVKTDLYTAEITTRGGLVRKWELTKYKTWNQHPVQLVDFDKGGDFSLLFLSKDGKQINTRNLFFEARLPSWKTVTLQESDTLSVDFVLPIEDGKRIVKRFTFRNGTYELDVEHLFQNFADVVSGFEYQIIWEHGLPYAERNSIDESHSAHAYAMSGGELAEIDATSESETVKKDITGVTDWVAARNKYFALAMFPDRGTSQGAFIEGSKELQPDRGEKENYSLALKMPFKGTSNEASKITLFLGPLDFSLIKSMDRELDRIMSLGPVVIRQITEYALIPLFNFLHIFISNWGVVIIVFSIIIKIVLHPLTRTSMKSMKRMQQLQPMMTELREKYKDNPEQMNKSIMNLYKEYGVNPAGGCLPILLQMPILFALYNVFSSTIQLRQSPFVWWIQDLSIPDSIVHLPFTVPLFGMSQISGVALAMCITMFIQQKQTVTDPRQKAMVWLMPIMMMLIFNSLPSGLNLYYFVFNLLSIGQQFWINKQHGDEPLKKVDPKKAQSGIIARLAKNMPDIKKR